MVNFQKRGGPSTPTSSIQNSRSLQNFSQPQINQKLVDQGYIPNQRTNTPNTVYRKTRKITLVGGEDLKSRHESISRKSESIVGTPTLSIQKKGLTTQKSPLPSRNEFRYNETPKHAQTMAPILDQGTLSIRKMAPEGQNSVISSHTQSQFSQVSSTTLLTHPQFDTLDKETILNSQHKEFNNPYQVRGTAQIMDNNGSLPIKPIKLTDSFNKLDVIQYGQQPSMEISMSLSRQHDPLFFEGTFQKKELQNPIGKLTREEELRFEIEETKKMIDEAVQEREFVLSMTEKLMMKLKNFRA